MVLAKVYCCRMARWEWRTRWQNDFFLHTKPAQKVGCGHAPGAGNLIFIFGVAGWICRVHGVELGKVWTVPAGKLQIYIVHMGLEGGGARICGADIV